MYRLLGIMLALIMFTGCAYDRAVNNLTPQERNAFWAYRKVMRGLQTRTYLSKPTEAERTAYLRDIGIQQRFEALSVEDRESVLNGFIRRGMSADALRFLWGMPEYSSGAYSTGAPGEWEYWIYRGYASDLFKEGSQYSDATSQVRVYLVDNQVEWWTQEMPDSHNEPDVDTLRR